MYSTDEKVDQTANGNKRHRKRREERSRHTHRIAEDTFAKERKGKEGGTRSVSVDLRSCLSRRSASYRIISYRIASYGIRWHRIRSEEASNQQQPQPQLIDREPLIYLYVYSMCTQTWDVGQRRTPRDAPVEQLERLRVVGGEAHETPLAEFDERQSELEPERRLALAERHASRLAPLDQLALLFLLLLCTHRQAYAITAHYEQ